jgi:hypothetical protein
MIEIGKSYLFHTHLGIWLGRVVQATHDEIELNQCSWVHQQGRMGASVRDGLTKNHEFVGDGVVVPRNCIKVPWPHELPKEDK